MSTQELSSRRRDARLSLGDNSAEENNNNNDDDHHRANRQTLAPSKLRTYTSDGNASDGESWHILDAEEEPVGNNNNGEPMESRAKTQSRDFIEVCPDSISTQQSTPSLVKLCATLYALVPIAGFITTHLLLVLVFTRYWYVTAIYVTYLLLDKQSCNQGKCSRRYF